MGSLPGSAVIFLGSMAFKKPLPWNTVYAGTKSYLVAIATALNREMSRRPGILFQVYSPAFVASAMTGLKPWWPIIPTAEVYAESALSMLGVDVLRGAGWFWHELVYHLTPSAELSIVLRRWRARKSK